MAQVLRAVLFDFNGVLLDDEAVHFAVLRQVVAADGVPLSREDYYADLIGLDDRSALALLLEAQGRAAETSVIDGLLSNKARAYEERARHEPPKFFPGVSDLLDSLTTKGLMLGIVSGALRQEVDNALERGGFAHHFKAIVAAGDAARGKPHPDGYRLGLARLNEEPPLPERLLHPHEVMVIEDTPLGLEAAATAGMVTVGLAQNLPAERLLFADSVADRLADLSVERLGELYSQARPR